MSDELLYKLKITVADGSDISEIEDSLKNLLMDLYNADSVEGILVKDRTPPIDEDIDAMLDVIDDLETENLLSAIKFVEKLEDIDND
jgi:hypothetical protein